VITAKAKLDTAADGLANCLKAKVDIQAKIDKVEELRDAAKKGLDQCLQTKAQLKASLDECHTRRDSARGKLEECLNRKKDLKVKIEACHKKRDEARAKLTECLANKKALSAKIAQAKSKLGGKSSSLVQQEPEANASEESDALEDMEAALDVLKKANADADENAQQKIEIGNQIEAATAECQSASSDEQSVLNELKETSVEEAKQQVTTMQLQTKLQETYEGLKAIDRQADAARAESEAVGKIADQAGAALSSLLQRLTI